nr:ABC transporter permease [Flavihumibacter sp.]
MRSTIKTIIRRLRRAPLFSFLNVFGLAIGISACWVICQMVGFEFSYENKLENRDQVYRLVSGFVFDNKESWNGGVSKPMYQALRDQVPQLQKVVPVFRGDVRTVKVGSTVFEEPVKTVQTDSAYFDLIH